MRHLPRQEVLLTGATGAIGPNIAGAFLAAGNKVRTLALDPPKPGALPAQVTVALGDISDPEVVRAAMEDAGVVIHMAALLHVVDPPESMQGRYHQVNVQGTENVVQAALMAGVQRVVFFSTIAVYGQGKGELLTEDSPPHPDSFYAQTKLEAETIVLQAKRSDGQPLGCVLRLAAVYGAGVKGNYRRLVRSLAHRRFIPVGDGTNRRTLVFEHDVANAALLAAQHPAAAGRIYNVTDGQYHSMGEIVRVICDALGRREPRARLPLRPARLAAGLIEDAARFAGLQAPAGRATIDKYTEDCAVSGGRIQRELGFAPEYDLRRGWAVTVLKMRQTGEL